MFKWPRALGKCRFSKKNLTMNRHLSAITLSITVEAELKPLGHQNTEEEKQRPSVKGVRRKSSWDDD